VICRRYGFAREIYVAFAWERERRSGGGGEGLEAVESGLDALGDEQHHGVAEGFVVFAFGAHELMAEELGCALERGVEGVGEEGVLDEEVLEAEENEAGRLGEPGAELGAHSVEEGVDVAGDMVVDIDGMGVDAVLERITSGLAFAGAGFGAGGLGGVGAIGGQFGRGHSN
jgi:hypothetical protein